MNEKNAWRQHAWRHQICAFPRQWLALFIVCLVDGIWAYRIGLTLSGPWLSPLILVALDICLLLRGAALFYKSKFPLKRLALGFEFFALTTGCSIAICILSYLVATTSLPLVDSQLMQLDKALGFDWLQWQLTLQNMTGGKFILLTYRSLETQIFIFLLFYALMGQQQRLGEMFWILFICLLMTLFIFMLNPALGPASTLGTTNTQVIDMMQDLTILRAGHDLHFSFDSLTGIISYPSFHTSAAIIYSYGFRKTGLLTYVIWLLNIVMATTIPTEGDHYLVDMIAGALIAGIAIFFGRKITAAQQKQVA